MERAQLAHAPRLSFMGRVTASWTGAVASARV